MEVSPQEVKPVSGHAELLRDEVLRHIFFVGPVVAFTWQADDAEVIKDRKEVVHARNGKWSRVSCLPPIL